MKCLLCFPRQLCCPLALVKKRVSRFPVPRPRAPQRAAHGEIREFQPAREGSERSVLLRGHGQKYPGKTVGGHVQRIAGSNSFSRANRCKNPWIFKSKNLQQWSFVNLTQLWCLYAFWLMLTVKQMPCYTASRWLTKGNFTLQRWETTIRVSSSRLFSGHSEKKILGAEDVEKILKISSLGSPSPFRDSVTDLWDGWRGTCCATDTFKSSPVFC